MLQTHIHISIIIMLSPLIGGGIKRCFCLTSDVCRVHREHPWRPQLLEPRRAGRLSLRRKACMGWSWTAACGAYRGGHIVATSRLKLVICRETNNA